MTTCIHCGHELAELEAGGGAFDYVAPALENPPEDEFGMNCPSNPEGPHEAECACYEDPYSSECGTWRCNNSACGCAMMGAEAESGQPLPA